MSAQIELTLLLDDFKKQRPLRAGSLIISLFGDAITPRADKVWLGSLFELLSPFGINERLVRTSVYRLVNENWLNADKQGRRSYYSLTQSGSKRFHNAFEHVYQMKTPHWHGSWCLVFLNQLKNDMRKQVRDELEWLSFGSMGNDVLLHPRINRHDITALLNELSCQQDVIVMQTEAISEKSPQALYKQVNESWNLDQLAQRYHQFIARFTPLYQTIKQNMNLTDQECHLARTLLIHEYRKIVLKDPQLPDPLLPNEWEGYQARQLCRSLYQSLYAQADSWLDKHLENEMGKLPPADDSFYQRFGGL
jgi:phenylacetic acid degradation operon negative regulatory protein